jgi:hypothetical protein
MGNLQFIKWIEEIIGQIFDYERYIFIAGFRACIDELIRDIQYQRTSQIRSKEVVLKWFYDRLASINKVQSQNEQRDTHRVMVESICKVGKPHVQNLLRYIFNNMEYAENKYLFAGIYSWSYEVEVRSLLHFLVLRDQTELLEDLVFNKFWTTKESEQLGKLLNIILDAFLSSKNNGNKKSLTWILGIFETAPQKNIQVRLSILISSIN